MPIAQPPAPDSRIADLLLLLRQPDLDNALHAGLTRLLQISGAEGGTLSFGTGARSISLRMGSLPAEVLATAEQAGYSFLARPDPRPAPDEPRHHVAVHGDRTLIALPLACAESFAGAATLVLPAGQSLNEDRLPELQDVADIIGVVGCLLHELDHTRRQLKRLGLIYEIGQALASTLDLSQLLRDTMQLATEVIQGQASSLMLIDYETNELVYEIVQGSKRDELQQFRMPLSQGVAGWVATTGQPLIVNDPGANPRFNRKVDERTGFLTRNILCVPLEIKGRIIGVLQVLNKQSDDGFNEEDLELLRTVASQAAVAIENAQLYRNLREERDRIIEAQEEVRRELARSLHDGTVQLLSALSMNIEHVRALVTHAPELIPAELDSMRHLTNRAIRETRTLLFELRPIVLETQGLVAALDSYVAQLNEREGPGAKVVLEAPPDMMRLPPKVERTLFGIVQEAVTNARKHAEATRIQVVLRLDSDLLEIAVKDDGRGFDLQRTQAGYDRSGSLGLINMRERAEMIEATLRIDSSPEQGTQVVVRLPLAQLPLSTSP